MSGGALAATGVAGLASIVIARTLGVSDRGLWAVVSSSAVLAATIAALGLPEGAAYGTARSPGRERGVVVAACTLAAAVLGARRRGGGRGRAGAAGRHGHGAAGRRPAPRSRRPRC